MLILDLETDGLFNECTKIHCAVAYDTVTDKFTAFLNRKEYNNGHGYSVRNNPDIKLMDEGGLSEFLDKSPQLSCHNGIGFDLKVLKKILNYQYKGQYVDTLLLSRILWPDLEPPKGSRFPHSVEAWGIRFGIAKPEHEDWSTFSPEMLHRCKEDVKIQAELYKHIQATIKQMSIKDGRFLIK